VNGLCTNLAGLVTNASLLTIKIDKTPPVVTVTGVANGQTYVLGSVPAAGCSTTDVPSPPQSGVATNASLTTLGGPVGSITSTCSGAKDNAGNSQLAPVSATYAVIYNWSGFFQPVDNPGPGPSFVLNSVKAGSAIPVKFSLGGNQGLNIFTVGSPSSAIVPCGTKAPEDVIEETVTAGNSSLNYDATANQYIYVWKTDKTWVGQCRQLSVKLIDGTTHTALFKFK
jgi:hypothetical protein